MIGVNMTQHYFIAIKRDFWYNNTWGNKYFLWGKPLCEDGEIMWI